MTTPGQEKGREDAPGRAQRREDAPGRAQRREDTQPQSPVAVAPPLPNRRNSELVLLGFAAVITTVALLIVEANQERGLQLDLVQFTVGFVVLFGGAHLAVRRYAPYADPLLLPVVALLNGLGLVLIYRLDLSAHTRPAGILPGGNANQQMLWTLLGILVFTAVLMVVHDHRMLARYGYICGLAGLVLLAIPAVLPDSVAEQYGAKIWIRLPGFSIQPAEFSKILLLIFFASVLVTKRSLFTSAGKHMFGMDLPRPRDLAPLLVAWIGSIGVMVFEKDLGASLLLYATFLVLLYVATEKLSWVIIGLSLFCVGSFAAYQLFDHVRVRVQNWLDPFADPDGAGYQMVQSLFSFATGGIFGTGLGNGQPGTVPDASTDFIIAVVGEELGLVGLAAVLMLYTIVIIRGLRTAIAVRDSFGKLLAAGLSAALALQLFIVVGGVTKLIPQTGLTTPWMSYGGSSLLSNYVLLALLLRVSHVARRPLSTRGPNQSSIAAANTEVIEKQ
ncbi:FtsW/RodA/SpoVE family cell cycle protein [Mycolicibacterium sp. lyk4-40-TYG-92]|uniref:FtsW/RodA/SpoVE family cell cycle protein n=1 Tax=Mycolicibacterium sp. lyk4-40-TYG-92 TaxID=3040295 RepID=UPI0025515F4F|nr:FtsW/RodA/SpoVE family cell cycle protein [Mycolicibacterium sp. lyk4-40-TYG-92]